MFICVHDIAYVETHNLIIQNVTTYEFMRNGQNEQKLWTVSKIQKIQ